MKKNVAGQKIGAQMVSATDGSAFTSAVTVYVTGDAGTQAVGSVGSGACAHEGNGYHTYAPAQAETNYDLTAFTFIGTGAVPATIQIFNNFPQTGDNFARLGAPAGASVSADIAAVKTQTAAIEVDTGTDIYNRLGAPAGASISADIALKLATSGYTAPPTAVQNRQEMDANSTKLDVTVGSRLATAGYTTPPTANAIADQVWDELISGHATSGTTGAALSAATAPSAAAVADAVWDEALSGHATAGTAGAALSDAGGAGAGAITLTYTVLTDGSLPIPDVDVWVASDTAGQVVLASGRTNSSGVVTFYLDAGTVYVFRQKSGWNFTNPETVVVA